MTKYIVAIEKSKSTKVNLQSRREQLACEIIANLSFGLLYNIILISCEAESPSGTLLLMDKTAIAFVEIDEINEKLWQKEVFEIYKRELAIRNAIDSAFHKIMSAADAFDEYCNESTMFQDIAISDQINFENAFDCITTSAHSHISDVVRSMFKVQFLNLKVEHFS